MWKHHEAHHIILTALLLAPLAVIQAADALANKSAKPNVVFIISDDHGWTDHGFMGHKEIQTPHIDRLAREGLTFARRNGLRRCV